MTSHAIKKTFVIAIFIRLVCFYLFRNITNYDLQSYLQVGELTLKGINIYPKIANLHHPYLPFFLYIEAFAIQVSQIRLIGLMSPILIIKSILIFFDLGNLYLVYLLSKKNLKTAFIYAINPVTILITTLHGQFDVLPIFFILLSIYLLKKKSQIAGILSYSFAILTKTWPILFIIPILRKAYDCHPRENGDPEYLDSRLRGNDRKVILLILISTFPILFTVTYCLLFKATLIDIGKTLISYQGLWGIWGILVWFGKTRILWQKLSTIIFLTCVFAYSLRINEKSLIKNIYKLLIFFFVFTTNFSIQYFVWIIPFLVINKPKNYISLIILITIYLASFYYFLVFCSSCSSTPNWLKTIQLISGLVLWVSFIKIGYILKK